MGREKVIILEQLFVFFFAVVIDSFCEVINIKLQLVNFSKENAHIFYTFRRQKVVYNEAVWT
jgi:hypothetical protein